MGITIPIIPGIKPLAKLSQLSVVPRTFHCDIPEALAREIVKCKTDEDAKKLGIEWTVTQCKELYAHGVNDIHFYTVGAVDSVVEIVKALQAPHTAPEGASIEKKTDSKTKVAPSGAEGGAD